MAMMTEEQSIGYMLIREEGHCGTRGQLLASDAAGVEDCAALAQGAGAQAFSVGIQYARGKCYAEKLVVTQQLFQDLQKDRASPPCAEEGGWTDDALYDFYVLDQQY